MTGGGDGKRKGSDYPLVSMRGMGTTRRMRCIPKSTDDANPTLSAGPPGQGCIVPPRSFFDCDAVEVGLPCGAWSHGQGRCAFSIRLITAQSPSLHLGGFRERRLCSPLKYPPGQSDRGSQSPQGLIQLKPRHRPGEPWSFSWQNQPSRQDPCRKEAWSLARALRSS